MQIERVAQGQIGLTFQGFFDTRLKDMIKEFDRSSYDVERKVWTIPAELKDKMISDISSYCLENNILVD